MLRFVARCLLITIGIGIGIVSLIAAPFRKKLPARIADFWTWFGENESVLFSFDGQQAYEKDAAQLRTFAELKNQLEKVDDGLAFEFGPLVETKREFMISAGGNKSLFPVVEALADAAPALERWTIVRFRQPRQMSAIKFGGQQIGPDDIKVELTPDEGKFDINVYVGSEDMPEQVRGQLAFLALDFTLGEQVVATRIGGIQFLPTNQAPDGKTVSLAELPARLGVAIPDNS